MRILHVNKFLYRRGGAESYMLDVARRQRAAGHEVALFGMQHPENEPQLYQDYFPSYAEFEPPPRSVPQRVKLAGRMLWSSSAARGIATVVDQFRPDVVHCHNIYHQLSPSILHPLGERKLRVVMTLHDYKLACPTYQMLDHGKPCDACFGGHFHQAVLRRCKDDSLLASAAVAMESWAHTTFDAYDPVATFICPSRFMLESMKRARVFPERLRHVPHFVDVPDEFVPSTDSTVVFVGRLSAEKGVDTLITAVGALGGAARLEIAGTGPAHGDLEDLADRVAKGRVKFHGRLDRSSVEALMRRSACVVVPSRWYENQPMTVLEAMAAGRPVIATGLGGLPELIDDGVDGRIVPPDDPKALAEVLGQVVADPETAERMGRAAREKAISQFSAERHFGQLSRIYAGDG